MSLSEKTKKTLEKYGWSAIRRVDISKMVKSYEDEGYILFDAVKDFLQSFGGLHFMMPEYMADGMTKLHFDAIVMSLDFEHDWAKVQGYENRVGERLIPVGEAYNGYWILMISESGKMYGAYCDTLRLQGNTYEEAIENLYQRVETPLIP